MTEIIKTVSEGVTIVGAIIKAAGDNPHVKEAGSNLGKTAVTITRTINNALLPLAAVNFAFDKAHKYFNEKFSDDLASKVEQIPAEHLAEPKASIAGPALQGLAFTHEEQSLKDMYLSLIAKAMDSRHAASAHPAFVEMIKQLDATEARLLKSVLPYEGMMAVCKFRIAEEGSDEYFDICEHVIPFRDKTGAPREYDRMTAMVQNWIRLGLVSVSYEERVVPGEGQSDPYAWVEARPEIGRLSAEYNPQKVTPMHGVLEITALGKQFALAVGLGRS